MIYLIVAFALLAHVLFWGAGLAMLVMPRPWGRFWPILAGVAGLALQSTVVWCAAYADLPGTLSYGWASEIIPAVLLAAGRCRRRAGRRALSEVAGLSGVWLICAAALAAMVWPLAHASKTLTTVSLGSCDAADFAGGGRVLMEFAHHDRTGFLGLTEVVRVLSVDNVFDFWLRMNHFTAAALIALNGAILGPAPYSDHHGRFWSPSSWWPRSPWCSGWRGPSWGTGPGPAPASRPFTPSAPCSGMRCTTPPWAS